MIMEVALLYFINSSCRMVYFKLVFEVSYGVGSTGTLVVSMWVVKLLFIMRVMILMSCHFLCYKEIKLKKNERRCIVVCKMRSVRTKCMPDRCLMNIHFRSLQSKHICGRKYKDYYKLKLDSQQTHRQIQNSTQHAFGCNTT